MRWLLSICLFAASGVPGFAAAFRRAPSVVRAHGPAEIRLSSAEALPPAIPGMPVLGENVPSLGPADEAPAGVWAEAAPVAAPAAAQAAEKVAEIAGGAGQAPAERNASSLSRFWDAGSRPAADDTAILLRHLEEVRLAPGRRPLPAEALETEVLFVPGFNWDFLGRRYFLPARRRLAALGLKSSVVPTDALGTVEANAAVIRAHVEKASKPVILIGHSKGGNDIFTALELFPELGPKIRKVLTLQSPLRGTPLADVFLRQGFLCRLIALAAVVAGPWRLFAGDFRPWDPAIRELAVAHHLSRPPFSAAASGPEVFAVGTSMRRVHPILFIKKLLCGELFAQENDGVVPASAAVPIGARYARLERVGHLGTIAETCWRVFLTGMGGPYRGFAADFSEAAVRWMFE